MAGGVGEVLFDVYFLVVTDCCFIYSCNTGYIYRGESGNEGYFHGVVGNVFTHVYILGNRSFHVVTFHLSDRGSRGNFRGFGGIEYGWEYMAGVRFYA